jgi:DNA mismatch endonuclease (patch repair protein)
MARIRGKDTSPELDMVRELSAIGLEYERHCRDLPGKPDFVFRHAMVAVFVDGDFWHGFRFPLWKHKLSAKWQEKIEATRKRDQRNFAKLRRSGWKVVRIWEHQTERDAHRCAIRVREAITLWTERREV